MTWYQLWKRMCKQPLRLVRNKDVTIKIDGEYYKCKIVYTNNGSDWHLEIERDEKDLEEVRV